MALLGENGAGGVRSGQTDYSEHPQRHVAGESHRQRAAGGYWRVVDFVGADSESGGQSAGADEAFITLEQRRLWIRRCSCTHTFV